MARHIRRFDIKHCNKINLGKEIYIIMNEYWNFVNGNIIEYSTEELIEIIKKNNIGDGLYLTVEQLKKIDDKAGLIIKEKIRHCFWEEANRRRSPTIL